MRFPVAPELISRDGVSNKNARMTNVVKDGAKASVRPGLAVNAEYEGIGAGLISFGQSVFPIYGGTLFTPDGTIDIATGGVAVPPAWDVTWTYPAGFLVTYGGGTWRAVTPVLGEAPTAGDWSVVVAVSGEGFTLTSVYAHNEAGEAVSDFYGYLDGYLGSISPTDLSGSTIYSLATVTYTAPSYSVETAFAVYGSVASDLFFSLTVNGNTLNSADATFTYDSGLGVSYWSWSGSNAVTSAGSLAVSIVL